MKVLFLILALSTVLPAEAAFYRRSSTPRPHPHVSWKNIAAGGAAAGTVIAAYKVSNGVEEGMKTVAKEKPEVFRDTIRDLTRPFHWMLGLALIAVGVYAYRKLKPKNEGGNKC